MNIGDEGNPRPSPWAKPPARSSRFGQRLLILAALFMLLLLALAYAFPPDLWLAGRELHFARYVLLAAFVIISLAASRKSLPAIASQLAIWMLLMLVLVAGYGYRYELKEVAVRLRDELLPTRARTLDGGSVAVRRAEDGHFWIDAIVDDRTIRFLVDTGASDVVLSRDDAVRLGIPFESLRFARVFSTANGLTRGAAIELRQIRLGSISFDYVSAWVNEGEMAHSLLGMRLLEQLSSVEIKNDTLLIKR
jgi:aspartyl protease family protein